MRFFGLMLLGVSLSLSCTTTGALVEDSKQSMGEIRLSIKRVFGETPREIRQGGRQFISRYISTKGEANFDPSQSKERAYARITVLGDRRPYDIMVEMIVERKIGGNYEEVGVDEQMSERLAHDLKQDLTRSRDEENVIDDFRAF